MLERARPRTDIFRGLACAAAVAGFAFLSVGCGDDVAAPPSRDQDPEAEGFEWDLPPGFPEPRVPEGNPMTEEKVELGRHLFYDKRLSGNQTQSCASCHQQALAFTDGRDVAIGSTGEHHPRNSMSLANVGYQPRLTWADPNETSLAEQIRTPLLGDDPVELGMGDTEELLDRLRSGETYQSLFPAAFPDQDDPVTVENLKSAIASFQRTLISGDSPEDRFRRGEESALTETEQMGRDLFFSETPTVSGDSLGCFRCHADPFFTATFDHAEKAAPDTDIVFDNTGLYNLDENGSYPEPNTGLYRHTGELEHMGHFKVPTLRNVALTAPYMHDGSVETLDDVLDHYAAGGRTIEDGDYAGVGSENPHKSHLVTGFTLTAEEREAVIAYLHALTDEKFISADRFSNPWPHGHPARGQDEGASKGS